MIKACPFPQGRQALRTEGIHARSSTLNPVSKKQAKVEAKVEQILFFLNLSLNLNLILLAMSHEPFLYLLPTLIAVNRTGEVLGIAMGAFCRKRLF